MITIILEATIVLLRESGIRNNIEYADSLLRAGKVIQLENVNYIKILEL